MPQPLIIFDFDGTIADSVGHIVGVFKMACQKLGIEPPPSELIKAGLGLPSQGTAKTALPEADEETILRVAQQYEMDYRAAQAHHHTSLFGGMLPLLQDLAKENKLAIATGKSREGLNAVLDNLPQLRGLFCSTHTASDGPGKPDPAMVMAAIAANGAEARRTVVIGDAVWDMQLAKNANVYAIGVTWGTMGRTALVESGADVVVEKVAQLKTEIEKFLG